MKLFLGWSGPTSKRIAESIRRTFPLIIQNLEVFLSAHDIKSGARWAHELADILDQTSFGVLCLTPNNLNSPWLYFEAGALTKHEEGRACCLLIGGLDKANVPPPLSQFQNRSFAKEEIHALLRDINGHLEKPLSSDMLDRVFDKFWPDLERDYDDAISEEGEVASSATPRRDREILEEILLRIRSLDELSARSPSAPLAGGGSDILSRAVSFDSLGWYTSWKFPGLKPSERVQQILLRDLDKGRYPTIGDLDRAVNKARDAVEAYANEQPRLFDSGTDFITKALGFVDSDFRNRHGFSKTTLEAFPRYEHLVDSNFQ